MTEFKPERECDVCRRKRILMVCNCGFGAMSLGYCAECHQRRSEPEWGFEYLLFEVANGDPYSLHESVKYMTTYIDGQYVSWDDWVEKNRGRHKEYMEAQAREFARMMEAEESCRADDLKSMEDLLDDSD